MDFGSALPQLNQFVAQLQTLIPTLRTLFGVIATTTNNLNTFNQQTQQSSNSLNALNQRAGQAGNSMNNLNQHTQRAGNSFLNFNRQGASSIGILGRLHSGVNNLRFGFEGLLVALGGREIWNFLIGTNQQIEVLQQSLEVTLKSSEKAVETIRSLRSYAALTPFQELETFKSGEMLAANRMEVDRWIKVAGDLASAKRTAGIQLEDVINVLTRINSGDFGKAMIRLRQMGISIADLKAKGLEFTRNNTFLGDTNQMLEAIEDIVKERYGGLTLALGQTVEGLISTIKDYFLQLGIDMGEKSFGSLKTFLLSLKSQLEEFRDSTDFKKIISGFNEFSREVGDGLRPWITAIGAILNLFLHNLPVIGALIKTYLYTQFIGTMFNLFRGAASFLINIGSNWIQINSATAIQNGFLTQQQGQLGRITMLLAQINALRSIGNQLATEQVAADASAAAMLQMGALKGRGRQMATAFGAAGAAGSSVAAGAAGTAGAAAATGGAAAGAGGVLAGIAAAAGPILAAIGIIMGVILIAKGIASILAPTKYELQHTTQDYERMLGAQTEDIEKLNELNSARRYSNDQIKYYDSLTKQHTDTVSELTNKLKTETEQYNQNKISGDQLKSTQEALKNAESNLAGSREKLAEATDNVKRKTDQILEVSPELIGQLTDENGKIKSNTDEFNNNTKAIEANIAARKNRLSDTYYQQLEAAGNEKQKAQAEIKRMQEVIDITSVDAGAYENPFIRAIAKGGGWLRGLVMNDDDQKVTSEGLKIMGMSKEDRQAAINDLRQNIYNEQKKVLASDKKLEEANTLIRQGYVVRDSKGKVSKDADGRPVVDWERWDRETKAEERRRSKDIANMDVDTTDIEDIVGNTKNDVNAIKNKYQSRLNMMLAQGKEKTDPAYQAVEDTMYNEMASFWESKRTDVNVLVTRLNNTMNREIESAPKEIQSMLKAGIGVDKFLEAVDLVQKYGVVALDSEMSRFKTELQKIATSGINPDTYTSDFKNLMTRQETAQKLQDAINEVEVERTEALANKVKSTNSGRSPLDKFNDQWEKQRQMLDAQKDITLSNDEIAGREEGSAIYEQHRKEQNYGIRTYLFKEIEALKKLMPSLDTKERFEARLQALKLQKEANDLLLEIKKNTEKIAEFNKPSSVKAITYYDYKTAGKDPKGFEIANANFTMNVEAPANAEELEGALNSFSDLAQKKYGKDLKRSQNAGVRNPKITGM
jgi:hypothetical protein